jgi:hypothetical protein
MVSGGPDQGKTILDSAIKDLVYQGKQAAHGQFGSLIGKGCGLGIRIKRCVGLAICGGHPGDMGTTMDPGEFIVGGRTWGDAHEPSGHIRRIKHVIDDFKAFWAFNMRKVGKVLFVKVVADNACA